MNFNFITIPVNNNQNKDRWFNYFPTGVSASMARNFFQENGTYLRRMEPPRKATWSSENGITLKRKRSCCSGLKVRESFCGELFPRTVNSITNYSVYWAVEVYFICSQLERDWLLTSLNQNKIQIQFVEESFCELINLVNNEGFQTMNLTLWVPMI